MGVEGRPALRPLPDSPYVFAEWKAVRVSMDYHVEVDGHYYSVPHALVRRQLDVRLTARTVECFHRGQRVASHVRSPVKGRHTTTAEHMPEKHRRMGDWTPDRFIGWAEKIGSDTAALITAVLARRHPQQAYRSCIGLQRLAKCYGDARLEAAAARALAIDSCSYRGVESILRHRLDEAHAGPAPLAPTMMDSVGMGDRFPSEWVIDFTGMRRLAAGGRIGGCAVRSDDGVGQVHPMCTLVPWGDARAGLIQCP